MSKRVSKQIGYSTEASLLYDILRQLEQLTKVTAALTTTTTTTIP